MTSRIPSSPGPESQNRSPAPRTRRGSVAKTYFPVTQVCRMLDIKPHVLRYWEQEFELSVKRNSAGRRIYSSQQVERLRIIKHLLRHDGLTVKGAKLQLARMKSAAAHVSSTQQVVDFKDYRQALLWLKKELIAVRSLLEPGH